MDYTQHAINETVRESAYLETKIVHLQEALAKSTAAMAEQGMAARSDTADYLARDAAELGRLLERYAAITEKLRDLRAIAERS